MLFEWVLEQFHCMLEVLERPRGRAFRVVPRAWLVERTLAWISRCRRLSQDDDKLPRTWETFIYLAMIELMLKRVAGTFATSKTPSQSFSLKTRSLSVKALTWFAPTVRKTFIAVNPTFIHIN